MICQHSQALQIAFQDANGLEQVVRVLKPCNSEVLLEMAAGAVCALCEGCDPNKDKFREEGGLEPLISLLDHACDAVKLNAAKALCHLAENEVNRKIVRELGGLERLV